MAWHPASRRLNVAPSGRRRSEAMVAVWVIPRGVELYRGRTERVAQPGVPATEAWFADERETSEIYGYTDVFRVERPIVALNFEDPGTHALAAQLYEQWATRRRAPASAFLSAYPLDENGAVLRESTFDVDALVTEWFLQEPAWAQLDGFATQVMPSVSEQDEHHAEVFLRQPRTALEYVGTDASATEEQEAKYAYQRVQRLDAAARSRRRPVVVADDEEDEEDTGLSMHPRKLWD